MMVVYPLVSQKLLKTVVLRSLNRRLFCRVIPINILIAVAFIIGCANALGQNPILIPTADVMPAAKEGNDSCEATNGPQPPQDQQGKSKSKKEKRGSLIIAPIPISSPAFGSGLFLVTGYVFKLDKEAQSSPPSWLGAAGAFTNNGTRVLALGGRMYLSENKYQTTFAVAKGRANLDFFGIGRIPGSPTVSVPLQMEGTIYFGEVMRKIGRNIFVGPRYQYRRLSAKIDGTRPPGGFEIPAIDLRSNSAALGVHIQRDLRDSSFYPTKGSVFDFTADFFDQAWGSRREYQSYKIAYNGFREIAQRQVLGYRLMGCSANGSVPFYDLCLYGFNNDLRGYTTGQFQNRRMLATQAEYRLEWQKRLGFVAFGGVGGIARTWKEFRFDQLLPAGGVGLRFNLDKKNHINYRVDLGFGREGRTVSIGVGEAF